MFRRVNWFVARRAVWLAGLMVLVSPSLVHAQTKPEETSLQFVPADSGFYATLLRNRDQWEIFKNSKAYAKLQQNYYVQLGLISLRQQWDSPSNPTIAMLKEQLAKPENQQLLALLKEAGADEIFIYGDSGFAKQLAVFQSLNSAQSLAQLEAASSGQDVSQVLPRRMLEVLNKHVDEIQVPVFTIGAKIKDQKAAIAQLQRLEDLLKQQISQEAPQLTDHLKRMKIGQDDYLVMSLDGSLLPWDEIAKEKITDEAQFNSLKEKISQKTVAVAVGIHGSYIILSVGPNTDHLAKLGKGDKLTSRKEFAPLKKHLDKRITSIGYASAEFLQHVANVDQQLDSLSSMAKAALPLSQLDQESQQKILSTVEDFVATAKKQVPRPGAALSVNYLTDRGYEAYSYEWSQSSNVDGSKPLSILRHVGGRPLVMVAGRTKYQPEQYTELVRLLKQGYSVGNEIALKQLQGEEKEVYEKLREKLLPLAERLDRANREMFLPAMKDSQTAFVIDADLTTMQIQNMMPLSNITLPIPEIALVCGVSDAELLKKGAKELFDIAQQAINAMREVAPDNVPPIEMPSPQIDEGPGGNIYSYQMPEEWGIDSQVALNAGLSKDTLVLSTAPATSRRMLPSTPLFDEGVLSNVDRPLAAAAFLDFAGLVETATPWIRYGLSVSQGTDAKGVDLPFQDVLDVLKCFQYVTSVTYQEDNVWVTHAESHFRDLQE